MIDDKNIERYKRKSIKKTLNTKSYIMYIGDKMSQKVRLGKKEKVIIDFLAQHPEGVWLSDLLDKFSWSKKYDAVLYKRLERLAKKGFIIIQAEINPSSGRSKQRVYLKQ